MSKPRQPPSLQVHPNVASIAERRQAREQRVPDPTQWYLFVDPPIPVPRTRPAVGRPLSKDAAGYAVALGIQKRARAAQNPSPVLVADGPPRHRHLGRSAIDKIVHEIAREKARDARWWRKWFRAVLGLGRRSRPS